MSTTKIVLDALSSWELNQALRGTKRDEPWNCPAHEEVIAVFKAYKTLLETDISSPEEIAETFFEDMDKYEMDPSTVPPPDPSTEEILSVFSDYLDMRKIVSQATVDLNCGLADEAIENLHQSLQTRGQLQ